MAITRTSKSMLNCNKKYFKALLCLLLTLNASIIASAQRPAYYKMSALVREACRADLSSLTKRLPSTSQPTIIAFVKLAAPDKKVLEDNGCKVLSQYGNLYIAEIPLNKLSQLSRERQVIRIEAGQRATALMDTTATIVNAVPVQEGLGLPQAYTGKGVVVGLQDIGFDLTHPTFWSADMSTYRIKAMWDQLSADTLTSTLPVGRDYIGQDELLALKYPRDGLTQTHGTHTAGIAAGSGAEGNGTVSPYRGIAYDADICLVCNATSDDAALIDPKDVYKYTYAVDALGFKYIFDYADRVGKPCVINFSEGSLMDFRGDDQLYYEMLDSLTGPGHIIVASSGNLGEHVTYVRKDPTQSSASIDCLPTNSHSYVTTKSRGNFTFEISLPDNGTTLVRDITLSDVLNSKDSTFNDTIFGTETVCTISASAYQSCYDGQDIMCDWNIRRTHIARRNNSEFDMSLTLKGDGLVEMYPAINDLYHKDGSLGIGENAYSINSPGSAPSVISVGYEDYRPMLVNYQGKTFISDTSSFGLRDVNSSVGPTFDERIKPDVMSPGQNIISSYNSFYQENNTGHNTYDIRQFDYNGRTYSWHALSGSSMAAPVVTGIIALWLQAYPKLTPEDCLEIISKTSKHIDESLSYPNNFYGYGQIDAEAGMRLVLEKAAAGIKSISSKNENDDRIYNIEGQYMGKDPSILHGGIYIRNGQKFVSYKR